jgi:hypothetical protein
MPDIQLSQIDNKYLKSTGQKHFWFQNVDKHIDVEIYFKDNSIDEAYIWFDTKLLYWQRDSGIKTGTLESGDYGGLKGNLAAKLYQWHDAPVYAIYDQFRHTKFISASAQELLQEIHHLIKPSAQQERAIWTKKS